ncbi:MAG: hypothetical protein HGA45_09640 [Chloroflexales bacterium]|nr:hypothetical protein [Chloroflexales bacterium]
MKVTYFEELERLNAREAERNMVFAALRCRRTHIGPKNVLATIFWLLGVT